CKRLTPADVEECSECGALLDACEVPVEPSDGEEVSYLTTAAPTSVPAEQAKEEQRQGLKDRLIREAIEDIKAELDDRAKKRQQLLDELGKGFQPNSQAWSMALPSRLLEAAAQIGRGPLERVPPTLEPEQDEEQRDVPTTTKEAGVKEGEREA